MGELERFLADLERIQRDLTALALPAMPNGFLAGRLGRQIGNAEVEVLRAMITVQDALETVRRYVPAGTGGAGNPA